mmetsp:Transcript_6700/g.16850  ORF Transcript_6700/g.16850 Transcript_6700/m.16850 type:complete len:347 (+) Transcript_6700:3-1043(+)
MMSTTMMMSSRPPQHRRWSTFLFFVGSSLCLSANHHAIMKVGAWITSPTMMTSEKMIGNDDGRTMVSSYLPSILGRSLRLNTENYRHHLLPHCRTTLVVSASADSSGNEDGETLSSGSPSSSAASFDPILRLPLFEAELASLKMTTKNEKKKNDDGDDSITMKLRQIQSEMDDIKATAEFSVRKTQYRFYEAFSNSDLGAMREVWSKGGGDEHTGEDDDVRCIHPGMESIDGYENIMSSWEQIFGPTTTTSTASSSSSSPSSSSSSPSPPSFTIEPERSTIKIHGITAICSCIEKTQPGDGMLECLNIYRREDGEWKMILHMASPVVMRTTPPSSGGGGSGGSAFF